MKNVVIVDDYFDFAKVLAEFIGKKGEVSCKAFGNSNEAHRYVTETEDIDVVLTDYEMPRLNGFQLANKLLESNSGLRIIIMSGHGKKHLEKVAIEYGLNGKVELADKSDLDFFKTLFD